MTIWLMILIMYLTTSTSNAQNSTMGNDNKDNNNSSNEIFKILLNELEDDFVERATRLPRMLRHQLTTGKLKLYDKLFLYKIFGDNMNISSTEKQLLDKLYNKIQLDRLNRINFEIYLIRNLTGQFLLAHPYNEMDNSPEQLLHLLHMMIVHDFQTLDNFEMYLNKATTNQTDAGFSNQRVIEEQNRLMVPNTDFRSFHLRTETTTIQLPTETLEISRKSRSSNTNETYDFETRLILEQMIKNKCKRHNFDTKLTLYKQLLFCLTLKELDLNIKLKSNQSGDNVTDSTVQSNEFVTEITTTIINTTELFDLNTSDQAIIRQQMKRDTKLPRHKHRRRHRKLQRAKRDLDEINLIQIESNKYFWSPNKSLENNQFFNHVWIKPVQNQTQPPPTPRFIRNPINNNNNIVNNSDMVILIQLEPLDNITANVWNILHKTAGLQVNSKQIHLLFMAQEQKPVTKAVDTVQNWIKQYNSEHIRKTLTVEQTPIVKLKRFSVTEHLLNELLPFIKTMTAKRVKRSDKKSKRIQTTTTESSSLEMDDLSEQDEPPPPRHKKIKLHSETGRKRTAASSHHSQSAKQCSEKCHCSTDTKLIETTTSHVTDHKRSKKRIKREELPYNYAPIRRLPFPADKLQFARMQNVPVRNKNRQRVVKLPQPTSFRTQYYQAPQPSQFMYPQSRNNYYRSQMPVNYRHKHYPRQFVSPNFSLYSKQSEPLKIPIETVPLSSTSLTPTTTTTQTTTTTTTTTTEPTTTYQYNKPIFKDMNIYHMYDIDNNIQNPKNSFLLPLIDHVELARVSDWSKVPEHYKHLQ